MSALAVAPITLESPQTTGPRSGPRPASFCSVIAPCETIAGKYRLEVPLGEGGMGIVWRAFNLQLEAPVAIKVLLPELNPSEFGQRLLTEARAAARLVHPGIVRVFDVGWSDSGEPFIVMELLNGESMRDSIERGPLSAVDAVRLLLPVADALCLAHSRGVVHLDLKPDNIFIATEGGVTQPKLLDFGIAKVLGSAPCGNAEPSRAAVFMGSPDYVSPEQARRAAGVDHRSDIWSLCVVLYEALAGEVPFAGSDCPALMRSIMRDAPLPLPAGAGVASELWAIIERGLAKDREDRYSSVFELGQALASWLIDQGVQDDVTGALLSSKWLERCSPSLPPPPESAPAPAARLGAALPIQQHDDGRVEERAAVELASPRHPGALRVARHGTTAAQCVEGRSLVRAPRSAAAREPLN